MKASSTIAFRALICPAVVTLTVAGGCGARLRSDTGDGGRLSVRPGRITASPLLTSELWRADNPSAERTCRFEVTNRQSARANVRIAGKSCSCVDVSFRQGGAVAQEPLELGPGKTASCELGFTLTREERVHRAEVVLEALYADGYTEKHRLCAEAAVYEDFSFVPPHLHAEVSKDSAGTVSRELVVHRRFRGKAGREGHLAASVGPTWVSTSALEVISQARGIDTGIFEEAFGLTVTANASAALRSRSVASAQICISAGSTSNEEQARGCISLVLTKSEGLIAPEGVLFGPVEVGTSQRRRVLIRSADRKTFRVVRASSSQDDIRVDFSFADAEVGSQAWVAIVCRPTHSGSIGAQVTIETDYPFERLVSLDVKATGVVLSGDGHPDQDETAEGRTD